MPVGPAGEASRRSCSALNVTRVTVRGALVMVPKEPRSTVAVTVKLSTPPPHPAASADTTLPAEMDVQSTRLVAKEVRPSYVKSRWVVAPLSGSRKSTVAVRDPVDGSPRPASVARSPTGASLWTPPMRTPTGSGSCRKSSAWVSANTAPHATHCTASIGPQSRTAMLPTRTRPGGVPPSAMVVGVSLMTSSPTLVEVALSCPCWTSCVVPSEKVAAPKRRASLPSVSRRCRSPYSAAKLVLGGSTPAGVRLSSVDAALSAPTKSASTVTLVGTTKKCTGTSALWTSWTDT
mmetsp:Transcript_18722/g.44469  ORF Transcript_18722/g.44469 Transcript_18722/m.44469 type:complete len:291 (-) Transcript_18722:586-1458(-)